MNSTLGPRPTHPRRDRRGDAQRQRCECACWIERTSRPSRRTAPSVRRRSREAVTGAPDHPATPGHWYVTVDYGGQPGRGRASVRVLPGALPPLRQLSGPALGNRPGCPSRWRWSSTQLDAEVVGWDVFISHATDKDDFVRLLAWRSPDPGPGLVRRVRVADRIEPASEHRPRPGSVPVRVRRAVAGSSRELALHASSTACDTGCR